MEENIMITAGIKEARQRLTEYLIRVQKGEEVIITKRNEPIARISPIKKKKIRSLESHKDLRDCIVPKGNPLSKAVIELRREETY
jgi:prevent-host-death family protein